MNRERRRKLLGRYKRRLGCQTCGAHSNLVFHHVDPESKSFEIGKSVGQDLATLKAELAKCIILCRSCHNKLHNALKEPTGEMVSCARCGKQEYREPNRLTRQQLRTFCSNSCKATYYARSRRSDR